MSKYIPKHSAQKPKGKAPSSSAVVLLGYTLLYGLSITFWEIALRFAAGIGGVTLYPALFLFSLAVFVTALNGWFSGKADKIISIVLLCVLYVFYCAQLIYHRIFGSMFSVSMMGLGGDAITNFAWALAHSMLESIWLLLLFLLPVALYCVFLIVKKPALPRASLLMHGAWLAAGVVIWIAAVLALNIGGTGRFTAYDAYHNPNTTTDTAASKLGVLPTTVVEFGAMLFPASGEDTTLSTPTVTPGLTQLPTLEAEGGNASSSGNAEQSGSSDSSAEGSPDGSTSSVPAQPEMNVIEAIDFEYLATQTDDPELQALCQYYASVEPTNKNEYTGLFEGYNLIYICAESFCTAAIHPEITPTLYAMSNSGIILNNYYNSYINTTTNGEFSFMTGLWPDVSRIAHKGATNGSFCQTIPNYMPYGLGNIFTPMGVDSYAYHNYFGYYYNRAETHTNLGYECQFMDDGMTFTSMWPASDIEMFEQSVGDYVNKDRFNVYYMTFSGHGPYSTQNRISLRHDGEVWDITKNYDLNSQARYYLANAMELDIAMQHLMEQLEAAGKLENTVIVLTGDNYPYYLGEQSYGQLMGEAAEAEFGQYKSTCIMWCGGLEEPIVCDTYCCNVDILPTVLNLFGVEYDSRLLSGRDVFSDGPHTAVLYDKSFLNSDVTLNVSTGNIQWQIDTSEYDEATLNGYLEGVSASIDANYAAALKIVDKDFYRFVWEKSGLMTPAQLPPAANDE